ncbi:histone deacetylase complex protein [Mycena alexandri]|uniref:Histone deacetylase complex protein n=1 Tax=Mycena alexandri TaxID=1745969 RepID=A0AAD6S6E4_9AGAR|nr:histone deacetylase complex protein [Mycena alexandri]
MDVDPAPAEEAQFSREKTSPFLIRTFLKIGSFHRITLFEDGTLPTTDEQQLFTWKDATLREILTTLRNTAPHVAEYRHPLARFSFRTVYVEQGSRGRFVSKDLGMVYSRDILGEPGTLTSTAPRLLEDAFDTPVEREREREERTLDDLRFVPGDFLLIAVLLPKSVTLPTEISIKGAAPANGWRTGPGVGSTKGDSGWGSAGAGPLPSGTAPGAGRGGGHWRGDSTATPRGGRGGGRGGGDVGRDRDRDRDRDLERPDRRVPPPRRNRESPPHRGGWGDRGGRGRRGGRDSRSRSRSPPPPRRRRD